jgi:hypothetical protein
MLQRSDAQTRVIDELRGKVRQLQRENGSLRGQVAIMKKARAAREAREALAKDLRRADAPAAPAASSS